MTSEVLARFRIRRRPFVAKTIFSRWRHGYHWRPDCCEGVWTEPVAGASGGASKATVLKVYLLSVALYKHWLEIILKFNIAYYFFTGALISFYLARGLDSFKSFLFILPLALPLAIGIGAIVYAGHCVTIIRQTENDVKELKRDLDAREVLDMGYVADLLRWSSKGFVIMVIGLSLLILVWFIKTQMYRGFFNIFVT